MSNLKLPELTYESLCELANKGDRWVKIGYETHVRRDAESPHVVKIRHHSTVIANVSATKVVLYHGGYHSRTTADRLNRILYPNCGHHVGMKNGSLEVRYPKDGTTTSLCNGDIFYTKGN